MKSGGIVIRLYDYFLCWVIYPTHMYFFKSFKQRGKNFHSPTLSIKCSIATLNKSTKFFFLYKTINAYNLTISELEIPSQLRSLVPAELHPSLFSPNYQNLMQNLLINMASLMTRYYTCFVFFLETKNDENSL